MLLLVILGAIALVALRIAGVGNLAKKKTPTPSVSVSTFPLTAWQDWDMSHACLADWSLCE